MSSEAGAHRFYVAIMAEPDRDEMAADIVYDGEQVADVRRSGGAWVITLYPDRRGNPLVVPFPEFRDALRDAADRLDRLS